MRVAILASFNVDLLPGRLVTALADAGHPFSEVRTGRFGRIVEDALDPSSWMLGFDPDAVLVVPAPEDIGASDIETAIVALLDRLPRATIYVTVLGARQFDNEYVLDPCDLVRGQYRAERFVSRVRYMSERSPRIIIVDWERYVREDYFDPRLWYLGRMRLGPDGLTRLAELVASYIAAGAERYKVLAVDLDGTLWGGIIGEDGLSGIVLGGDGIGLAYQDLQRELLAIRDAGFILVACSKNNQEDADGAFRHSGMILHPEHFSASRVNWEDKATNLESIADELDLGIESFVLLDDDPRERERVRQARPEVLVPEMPEDPALRPDWLCGLPYFRRLRLTDADRERPANYRAHAERKRLRVEFSLEDYIASLDQKIDIRPVDEGSVARAAQLSQRTNQFNLANRRLDLATLGEWIEDPDVEMWTISTRDRFGDSGIVGLGILQFLRSRATIIEFVISCRALGRGIEQELLSFLIARARHRKAGIIYGAYRPSDRNRQAAEFYSRADLVPIYA